MANLAIKGHPTRGREVIEILGMLGGKDFKSYSGTDNNWCYTIIDGSIDWDYPSDKYKVFSLEEFLEKFPYKVGDKVNAPCKGCIKNITSMEWDRYSNTVTYKLDNREYTNIDQLKVVNDLQPYKKETMEDKSNLLQQLKEYFDSTPREVIEKEWHKACLFSAKSCRSYTKQCPKW